MALILLTGAVPGALQIVWEAVFVATVDVLISHALAL